MTAKEKAAARKLTLREAYERYYLKDRLGAASQRDYVHLFNLWEKVIPDNPRVAKIDNAVVDTFKQRCLEAGRAAATINGAWSKLRSVLRRLGPQETGNPWGLGVLKHVPAMRLVKREPKRPYRIPLDDLSRFYVACRHAQFPRCGLPAGDWWRCLVALAFFTGLRKTDLLSIRLEQIDLQELTLDIVAGKTGKGDLFPLHPIAAEHIKRIWEPKRALLFTGMYARNGGRMARYWRDIEHHAKVERHFTLHDIRRTAASEINRVERGLGKILLQHAPRNVTDMSYLNANEELAEAIRKMRVPTGFSSGPKMMERAVVRQMGARKVEIRADSFYAPQGPVPADWEFQPGVFRYKQSRWVKLSGSRWRMLKALAHSVDPVPVGALVPLLTNPSVADTHRKVWVELSVVRRRLKSVFGLAGDFDPIPCVEYGGGGVWTIHVPPGALLADEPPVDTSVITHDAPVDPADWRFQDGCWAWFRGNRFRLRHGLFELLVMLVENGGPVHKDVLMGQYFAHRRRAKQPRSNFEVVLVHLRDRLRRIFQVSCVWNPIQGTRKDGEMWYRLVAPPSDNRQHAEAGR